MFSKLTELKKLRSDIKRALRNIERMRAALNVPTGDTLIARAIDCRLGVPPEVTLPDLLAAVEKQLQGEILLELKQSLETQCAALQAKEPKRRVR